MDAINLDGYEPITHKEYEMESKHCIKGSYLQIQLPEDSGSATSYSYLYFRKIGLTLNFGAFRVNPSRNMLETCYGEAICALRKDLLDDLEGAIKQSRKLLIE